MTEATRATRAGGPGREMASRSGESPPSAGQLASVARRSWVPVVALVLIAAAVVWKAELLSRQFFVRDDFGNLDLAREHVLGWRYLSSLWDGHLVIGMRMVAWLMVKTSLYNWGLAAFIVLTFTALAGLACYRALRTLFGGSPRILLALMFYLVTPLTLPTFNWWSSAMESVPLQLAIFMTVTSHVLYVRTARTRHLAAAVCWTAFGLIFFEKALVLPLLLFMITAGYLVQRRNLVNGARIALQRFWKTWLVYLALDIGYLGVLLASLRTSASSPVPAAGGTLGHIGDLFRDSFLPGAIGQPRQWYPGHSFVLGLPPPSLSWLWVAAAVIVIVASVVLRRTALLAWATLAMWLLAADVAPLFFGRLDQANPALAGLDFRNVADAAPVAALCIGLAFWPVIGAPSAAGQARSGSGAKPVRVAIACLACVILLGSIWSAQLERATGESRARSFIANASAALQSVQPGTEVYDGQAPASIVPASLGTYSKDSRLIGDLAPGQVHWITTANGTLDQFYTFGADGRLYAAWVGPTASIRPARLHGCWPERAGQIVVPFPTATSGATSLLRLGYFLGKHHPVAVQVTYGAATKPLTLFSGLHAAFLPERGGYVNEIVISGLGSILACVGDAEAGHLEPNPLAQVIP